MASRIKTSDSLRDRHPYRDKSFKEKHDDDKHEVFDGFGIASIERNVDALKRSLEDFPLDAKKRALKMLLAGTFNVEMKIRVLQLGIVEGINFLLSSPEASTPEIRETACKLVESISTISQGKEAFYQGGTIPLLLNVLTKQVPNRHEGAANKDKDREAACSALRQIGGSFEGCTMLIDTVVASDGGSGQPDDQSRVISDLVWLVKNHESNEVLLQHALDTLCVIIAVPRGREKAARQSSGVIEAVSKVIEERMGIASLWLPMFEKQLKNVHTACSVLWSLCIDGYAQRSSGINAMPILGKLLPLAIRHNDLVILKRVTGYFTSILVNEKAKPVVIDECIPDTSENIATIMCNLLAYISAKKSGKHHTDGAELAEIEIQTVSALRSMSEYPPARVKVAETLSRKHPGLLASVFSGVNLFNPYNSVQPDMIPDSLKKFERMLS